MRVLLNIENQKASLIMEVLKNFKCVKTESFSTADSRFFEELKEVYLYLL